MRLETTATVITDMVNGQPRWGDLSFRRIGTGTDIFVTAPCSSHRNARKVHLRISLTQLELAIQAMRKVG